MTRREVITQIFKAICAAGLAPLLVHCSPPRSAGIRKVDSGAAASLSPVFQSILHSAATAPSLYNSQPWRVALQSHDLWHLGLDPDRLLPVTDPGAEGALLALGAFLENLIIAAGAAGYQVDADVPVGGDPTRPDLIRVRLRRGERIAYPMQRLRQRRVVKAGYLPRELTRQDAFTIEQGGEGVRLISRGERSAKEIADLVTSATESALREDTWIEEFSEWVRFTDEEAELRLDGLSRTALEYEVLKAWYWRRFSQPADLFSRTFREGRLGMAHELAGEGGGWLVIGSGGDSVPEILMAGRRIQQLFLQIRERGIAFHPAGDVLARSDLRRGIMQAGSMRYPRMLLRIGYVNSYPEPVTLRRHLGWFVRGGSGV